MRKVRKGKYQPAAHPQGHSPTKIRKSLLATLTVGSPFELLPMFMCWNPQGSETLDVIITLSTVKKIAPLQVEDRVSEWW